jgi:hypothetical protein
MKVVIKILTVEIGEITMQNKKIKERQIEIKKLQDQIDMLRSKNKFEEQVNSDPESIIGLVFGYCHIDRIIRNSYVYVYGFKDNRFNALKLDDEQNYFHIDYINFDENGCYGGYDNIVNLTSKEIEKGRELFIEYFNKMSDVAKIMK